LIVGRVKRRGRHAPLRCWIACPSVASREGGLSVGRFLLK
jgi:hypothetical protein